MALVHRGLPASSRRAGCAVIAPVGAAAGAGCGGGVWRWLARGSYRYRLDVPRLDLRWSWLVVVLAAAGAAAAAAAPRELLLAAGAYAVTGAGLAWIDWDVRRIPDAVLRVLAPVLVVLVALGAWGSGSLVLLAWSACGALVLGGAFFLMSLATSMGLGDVKLAAVTGLVVGPLGWAGMFTAVLATYLVGAVVALGLLAAGAGRRAHLAFGPMIIAGALVALATGTVAG